MLIVFQLQFIRQIGQFIPISGAQKSGHAASIGRTGGRASSLTCQSAKANQCISPSNPSARKGSHPPKLCLLTFHSPQISSCDLKLIATTALLDGLSPSSYIPLFNQSSKNLMSRPPLLGRAHGWGTGCPQFNG